MLIEINGSPCFSDGSGGIRCPASDASENSTSDKLDTRKFGFSDSRKSGFSEIWKSGNLKTRIFRVSENPDFRKSEFRKSGESENPEFRIFRFSGFSENRKTPKPGKKASDVEFAYVEFPLKSMEIPLRVQAEQLSTILGPHAVINV